MRFKDILVKMMLVVAMVATFSLAVYAGEKVDGGVWSYGGHHDPFNWGAFSNYFHPDRDHYSRVIRYSDSKASTGTASAGGTSEAFINTSVGENVGFEYGF